MVSSGTEATMSALRLARGRPGARGSSSSRAATTDTPTPCWSAPAAASRRSASRARPACPRPSPSSPSRPPTTTSSRRGRGLRALGRRDRLRHRRAGRRQHGAGATEPGFLEGCASCAIAQSGALLVFDEVMTGFRVSVPRGPGPLRRRTRPHLSGQGGGWRPAGGGLRRQPRDLDGPDGAGGPGLPGRAPSPGIRWPWPPVARDPAAARGPASTSELGAQGERGWPTGPFASWPRRAGASSPHGLAQRGRDVRFLLPPGPGAELRRGQARRTRRASGASSRPCSSAASTSPRRPTRRASCPWPTGRGIGPLRPARPSRPPAPASRPCAEASRSDDR